MGISFWHLLILGFIVLLVFGPSRLPNLGKSLGEGIRSFKKGLDEDFESDRPRQVRREQLTSDSSSPLSSQREPLEHSEPNSRKKS